MADEQKGTKTLGRFFKKGETIFKEGDLGNEMYIIQSGKVEVVKNVKGEEVVLATLDKNAFFGEMALFGDPHRSATIRAAEDTTMVVINKETLEQQFQKVPEWFVSILKKLVENLRQVNKTLKSRFKYGIDFSFAKTLLLIIKKYGEREEGALVMKLSKAKQELQTVLSLSNTEFAEKMKELHFMKLVKFSVQDNKLIVPDESNLRKFIVFLRSKSPESNKSDTDIKELQEDKKLILYFERMYTLINKKRESN
ncbi:hypothetical protein DRQ09_00415 [candidate division KSB1 bacterium]|nr:MAG: hypothetical protein DRQ09_00415 [candidate division KSB1 bacterium]